MSKKYSKEHRKKISESMRKHPERHHSYIDGRTLKRYEKNYCIDCKKEIDWRSKRCVSCENKRKHKLNILNCKGIKNPSYGKKGKRAFGYINGNGYEDYPPEFNNRLKAKIRKRDNYICQGENCKMTEEEHIIVYGKVLDIHHIDYDKQNCKEDNLITLCKQCNIRANFDRIYWQGFLKKRLNNE